MSYRPTPNFIIVLIVLLVLVCFGYVAWAIPDTLARAAAHSMAVQATAPSPRQDYRPDISHCHSEDVDLWNCIIHKE